MEKHQSSYENIVLYSTSFTESFTGTFNIAFGMQPFTAITTTHCQRELVSYPLYSNPRPTQCVTATHHMIVGARALTMTLRGRRVQTHIYTYGRLYMQ